MRVAYVFGLFQAKSRHDMSQDVALNIFHVPVSPSLTRVACSQKKETDDAERGQSASRNWNKAANHGEGRGGTEQPNPKRSSPQTSGKKGIGMYIEPVYDERADQAGAKVQVGLRVKSLLPGSPAALSGKIKVFFPISGR
jgi:hypothetical protein